MHEPARRRGGHTANGHRRPSPNPLPQAGRGFRLGLGDLDQQLAEVLAIQKADEAFGGGLEAVEDVLAIVDLAVAHPFAHIAQEVAELVGEMPEELGDPAPEPIHHLPDGRIEVQASIRVSEFNEELGLELPEEEDYETLAGFVLSELGRFPKSGESFPWDGVEFTVTEANDRRVLKVVLNKLGGKERVQEAS